MEETIDWTSFQKRIVVNKSLSEVYSAWATKFKIEQWFLQEANYWDDNKNPRNENELVQKGDSFTWRWHNWDFEEKGEVLKANNIDTISFTFGKAGHVHIELKSVQNGTEVTLTQDNIPTDERSKKDFYVGCSTGWTFWLTNLKAWLEHEVKLNVTGLKQGETKNLVNS